MEPQGVEFLQSGSGAMTAATLVPMLIFGCVYLVVLVAFIWGFFSMVMSQRRIASVLEANSKVLREIADNLARRA